MPLGQQKLSKKEGKGHVEGAFYAKAKGSVQALQLDWWMHGRLLDVRVLLVCNGGAAAVHAPQVLLAQIPGSLPAWLPGLFRMIILL